MSYCCVLSKVNDADDGGDDDDDDDDDRPPFPSATKIYLVFF